MEWKVEDGDVRVVVVVVNESEEADVLRSMGNMHVEIVEVRGASCAVLDYAGDTKELMICGPQLLLIVSKSKVFGQEHPTMPLLYTLCAYEERVMLHLVRRATLVQAP